MTEPTLREVADKLLAELDEAEQNHNDFWEGGPAGWPATIMLMTPRKTEPKGEFVRLFGRSGPKGRFLTIQQRPDGLLDIVARYNVQEVREYIRNIVAEAEEAR